jgi:peptide deformylase
MHEVGTQAACRILIVILARRPFGRRINVKIVRWITSGGAPIYGEIMALRTILEFPDPRLRTRAQAVTEFDAALGTLIDDLFETMYAAPGIGLAATQIDVHKRVIVIDVSSDRSGRVELVNPSILTREGEASTEEGCLSVPGIFDEVKRAAKVRVRAQDRTGAVTERDYEDILAVCIQHEMDHLEGKLFVDYLSDLKRQRIRKKLDKSRKERSERAAAPEGSAHRAY